MPTFPTYDGELPECLDPLNLRHYFLLAYWIYFRPTALKCYLYQADPDLYRIGPGLGIFRAVRVPAYRSLYLMVPGVIVLFSVLVGIPLVILSGWLQGASTKWLGWAGGIVLGTAVGIVGSMVSSAVLGMMLGGVVFGVVGGVAGGVALGIAVGVMSSVWFGVAGDMAMGIAMISGAALGMTGGAAASIALGVALGITFSMTLGVTGSVVFGMRFGLSTNPIVHVISFLALSTGALRPLFYPLQLVLAVRSLSRKKIHPLEWDELIILPLPGMRSTLFRRLQEDESAGLDLLAEVARNPFQRWITQGVLQTCIHNQKAPLGFLYTLLVHDSWNTYIFAPASRENWEQMPSVRRVLLGELAGQWVDCSSDPMNRLAERLVWGLTVFLRDRRKTPLTRYAGMLYELLDEETVTVDGFDLTTYAEAYSGLHDYPGGEEIAQSFEAMATFLSYEDVSALPAAATAGERNQVSGRNLVPIRPTVLTALNRLGQVGAEVATYRDATSRVNQLAALARATDSLDALSDYVTAKVMTPEQYILRRIIRQWRRLVSEAGGQVGRAEEVGPVANPYVAGNPVTGNLFVGREDILRRLEELWGGEGQKPSVVLYGHRRMGKSSILHNLGARFGTQTIIVDFNMQRVGLVKNTGELLYNLALALYDSLRPTAQRELEGGEPDEDHFVSRNPYTGFDRFLKRLDRVREDNRFIVTMDEFELIEALIADGRLEPHLLDFWRGLIQTYPWFVMAFAGLHTLEEMTRDYWNPLFGSVVSIPVSFLRHEAAWRLVTQPTPGFPLDYDQDAVERIIALTHGQPYLMQLIGHGLVTRFNRQTFEESIERERRFSLADVEAIIDAPEFYRDGDAYFSGVWRQAETTEPPEQTAVLHTLAHTSPTLRGGLEGKVVEEIARETELAPEAVKRALETLARHDIVMKTDDRWQLTVELMCRWIAQS
jgi:hypothetical protein